MELKHPESNMLVPQIEGVVVQDAFSIFQNMINNAAQVFNKEICRICSKSQGRMRNHFHGSEFGKCYLQTQRAILESAQKVNNNSGQQAIFLNDGHLHEEVYHRIMNNIGYRISHRDEEVILERNVTLPRTDIVKRVKIVCHTDMVLSRYGERMYKDRPTVSNNTKQFICEFKAVKNWYWKERATKGIISNHYYGQCQVYMEAHNVDYCLLFFKNRESSQILPPFIIQRDPYYIRKRFTYLAGIMHSIENAQLVPNEYTDDKCDACKLCDYYQDCWGK